MLVHFGKETAIETAMRDKLISINVNMDYQGRISNLPKTKEGNCIVCAYNKFGMKGMADMYICKTLEDMQELQTNYNRGGALSINWYDAPLYALPLIKVDSLTASSFFQQPVADSSTLNSINKSTKCCSIF